MAFKTKHGKWRVTMRVGGRRISRNFRLKIQAEEFERQLRSSGQAPTPIADVPTLGEYYETWKSTRGVIEIADSTLISMESRWKVNIEPDFGAIPLTEITEEDCLRIRAKLQATKSASYANLVLELFRMLTGMAHRRGIIPSDPWAEVKRIPVDERRYKFWTPIERDRFLNTARRLDPAFAELVTVAVHTGLRWGELRALQRRHLDFDRGQILVGANFRPSTRRLVARTKATAAIGVVPMNDVVVPLLKDRSLLAPEDLVFDPKVLYEPHNRLPGIAKAAGVQAIRFHDLRHTFASCLALGGIDLHTIQKLMRHKSIQTTLIYAHLCENHLAAAANRLCSQGKSSVTCLSPAAEK